MENKKAKVFLTKQERIEVCSPFKKSDFYEEMEDTKKEFIFFEKVDGKCIYLRKADVLKIEEI